MSMGGGLNRERRTVEAKDVLPHTRLYMLNVTLTGSVRRADLNAAMRTICFHQEAE